MSCTHCSDAARSVLQCQKAQELCEGSALLHGGDLHSTLSSAAPLCWEVYRNLSPALFYITSEGQMGVRKTSSIQPPQMYKLLMN